MNSFEIEKETCKRCQKYPVIVLSQIAVICKAEKIAGQKSTEIKCRKYYAITYNEQIVMQSGLKIEIKEIIEITGEIFKNINF